MVSLNRMDNICESKGTCCKLASVWNPKTAAKELRLSVVITY
jgi:hypothetical protein